MRYSYLQAIDPCGRMADPMFYDMASEGAGICFVHVFDGETAGELPMDAADRAFVDHNADARPRAHEIRSMSAGDVVLVWPDDEEPVVLLCVAFGWHPVGGNAEGTLVDIAARKAYGLVPLRELRWAAEDDAD